MILRLKGEVIEHDSGQVVICCYGVGYGVQVPIDEQSKLPVGSSTDLYIAEHIKEDAHNLFGFLTKTRKDLFLLLTSVNGVGPKAGMAILNIGNEAELRQAIAAGDIKYITAAKGVGKKVAERLVVDLKNRVGLQASQQATDFLSATPESDEAFQALVALGYSPQQASAMLQGIDPDLSTEQRLKKALQK